MQDGALSMDDAVLLASHRVAARSGCTIAVLCSYTVSLINFRRRLLMDMVANGHRVIACGPERDQPTIDALREIGVDFACIPMSRAGVDPLEDIRTLWSCYSVLREHSPDVVLAYTMKPIIYGLIAARLAGIEHRHALVTGLGYVFSSESGQGRLAMIRALATRLYRLAFSGVDRIFVYNSADAEDLQSGRMVPARSAMVMVPGSGVDLSQFKPQSVPPGGPVFLLVARLLREKGVGEFIDAARRLRSRYPHIRCQILGPLDPSPLAISREDLDRWGREGVVEYLGETSDVRPYLKACSVFVLPSYYREGIPRSILEAMAVGRAVITADTAGCRETVSDGWNGFIVPSRNVEGLAQAMECFIAEPGLAALMGQRSLDIARERYEVGKINRLLLSEMALLRNADATR